MIQNGFQVHILKAEKVQVNDEVYQPPRTLGRLEEFRVADYYCPDEWSQDGIFVHVKEGQPLVFDLRSNPKCACLVSVQKLNPVTGEPANIEEGLSKDPTQNYLVLPDQLWIDGYAREGKVFQFIVTKTGESLAVNEFVLPQHMRDSHALGFAFFMPKNPEQRPVDRPDFFNCPSLVGHEPSYSQFRVSDQSSPVSPNWFSPLHTPHNWQISRTRGSISSSKGMSCDASAMDAASVESIETTTGGTSNIDVNYISDVTDAITSAGPSDENNAPNTVDILADNKKKKVDKASMGMGGRIGQRIVTDENSTDYYNSKPNGVLVAYMALDTEFNEIISKGQRQDPQRKDKYIHSGEVGCIQVPLIK